MLRDVRQHLGVYICMHAHANSTYVKKFNEKLHISNEITKLLLCKHMFSCYDCVYHHSTVLISISKWAIHCMFTAVYFCQIRSWGLSILSCSVHANCFNGFLKSGLI